MTQLVTERIERRGTLRGRSAAQGSGRAAAPALRPATPRPTRRLDRQPVARARACAMPAPLTRLEPMATPVPTWRLTDRGIAVVLVVGLMIMVAALTVVGLTAMTVTGDGYRAAVSATRPS